MEVATPRMGCRQFVQIRGDSTESRCRQVFWLTDHPTDRAFSPRKREWLDAAFVPDYSGGTAVDLHHLP
jgi:hypothetical protein